ncbi:MAG: YdcF family protein [Micrococcales bacterium]|nr:YdcF family protein [Micrococcales bacterium]
MRRLLITLLVLVVGAAVTVIGPTVWVQSRSHARVLAADEAPARDVALVLGAGLTPSGTPTPFLAARLDVAARLLEEERAKVIVVSGNRDGAHDEPTAMRDYLVAKGVPAERIVSDFAGYDTYDSCSRARRVFGVDRLLVVSQGYHVPRAVAVCRGVGVDAVGVGDWSVREAHPTAWRDGALREWAANIKAALDVLSQRDPVLGPRQTSVQDALRSTG